jgi:hypothetical protein
LKLHANEVERDEEAVLAEHALRRVRLKRTLDRIADEDPASLARRVSAGEHAFGDVVAPDLGLLHVAERGLDLHVAGLAHHVAQLFLPVARCRPSLSIALGALALH